MIKLLNLNALSTAVKGLGRRDFKLCSACLAAQAGFASTAKAASSASSGLGLWPTEVRVESQRKGLQVKFNDGEEFWYPAELLRVESPSAQTARLSPDGPKRVVSGRRHVNIIGAKSIGNYAVQLQFDDLHGSGIYTWPFLHELGTHKFARIRQYLLELKSRGLSRDPPGRRTLRKHQDGHKVA